MDFTIYIMAEGNSSRMGEDKGLVKINGKEMMLYIIEKLQTLNRPLVIITSNPLYEKFGFPLIADRIKNEGPAVGVLTALEHSGTDKNLIISCDMPLVDESMLRCIVDQSEGAQIACFKDSFLFPFPGCYSKSIVNVWKDELEKGKRKLQELIPLFNFKCLPIEHPELFLNVNTPVDVQRAAEKLK